MIGTKMFVLEFLTQVIVISLHFFEQGGLCLLAMMISCRCTDSIFQPCLCLSFGVQVIMIKDATSEYERTFPGGSLRRGCDAVISFHCACIHPQFLECRFPTFPSLSEGNQT